MNSDDIYISATLPYSLESLQAFVANYNASYWPLHLVFLSLTVGGVYILAKSYRYKNQMIGGLLTLFWGWCGIVFYMREFATLNFLAPYFGWVFMLQATLILMGTVTSAVTFDAVKNTKFKNYGGVFFILSSLIIYPLGVVVYEGGAWLSYRMVGITPVATNLLTVGFLTLSTTRTGWVKVALFIIPVLHLLASCMFAALLLR